jgi:hypothetical protein
MNNIAKSLVHLSLAAAVGGAVLLWNGHLPRDTQSSMVSSAEAIIGRPLTPMSYAGVARRTTARAVGYGMAAGAVYGTAVVVAPPVVVAPACVQAVDPYGRIYTRCY